MNCQVEGTFLGLQSLIFPIKVKATAVHMSGGHPQDALIHFARQRAESTPNV